MTSMLAIIISKDFRLLVAFAFEMLFSWSVMDDFRFFVETACSRANGLEMGKPKCLLDVTATKTPQHLHGLLVECYQAFSCLHNQMTL